MSVQLINSIACGLIAFWATWCVLSGRVRDGIVGKLIYSAIAVSAFAVMSCSQGIHLGLNNAGLTLHVSLGLAGVRHMFVVAYWPKVKRWICLKLKCEQCLRDPRLGTELGEVDRVRRSG
ncbi:hypothetical protein ACI2KS_10620 [Pseudomonas sp. NPDC087358]|uniref:hypothetical protein n=1 Tax=Pseudomonas sp. NPDC087358 TaxID=3364439 RepID=UPI003851637A